MDLEPRAALAKVDSEDGGLGGERAQDGVHPVVFVAFDVLPDRCGPSDKANARKPRKAWQSPSQRGT